MSIRRSPLVEGRARFAGSLAAVALLACVVPLGCSSGGGGEATSRASYSLHFPSTEAAVVTDLIKVQVFDAKAQPTLCQTLVHERISQQALPTPILDVVPVRLCDLLANGGAYPIAFPYGERAVLVVATRGDADFLVGCTQVTATDAQFDVPISLSLVAGDVLPPSTTCTTIADHCSGKC